MYVVIGLAIGGFVLFYVRESLKEGLRWLGITRQNLPDSQQLQRLAFLESRPHLSPKRQKELEDLRFMVPSRQRKYRQGLMRTVLWFVAMFALLMFALSIFGDAHATGWFMRIVLAAGCLFGIRWLFRLWRRHRGLIAVLPDWRLRIGIHLGLVLIAAMLLALGLAALGLI